MILDRLNASMTDMPFNFLSHADPRQVLSFLQHEHPQTIALVLAHLPSTLASQILSGLDANAQSDVAHRIAKMDRTSPEVIRQVEIAFERKLSTVLQPSELSTVGGLQPLVDIINRSDRGSERLILEGLEGRDPELAEEIRRRMFMFEDIKTLDDRAIQLILRQVESNDLPPRSRASPRRCATRSCATSPSGPGRTSSRRSTCSARSGCGWSRRPRPRSSRSSGARGLGPDRDPARRG